ncbi:MAG TPA: serine hydrolase [Gemmatimonadaceae bacterium]|nr:serine hydrolase [Gemmatimonadaceae bacterium]
MRLSSRDLLLATLVARAPLGAQSATVTAERPLTDYVGVYAESPTRTLELVDGDVLYAVIDDAKYPLERAGADRFTNGPGDTISFPRDAKGIVTGYVERGVLHRRLSPRVSPATAALVRARAGGAPGDYRYRAPADRRDGIAVGDFVASPLGVATAERIVRGVLDGTWPDVHAVLLYHRGRLVLEEYFYGYDVARPHQLRSATKSIVGALVGAAVDRGALAGVHEPVLARLGASTAGNPDPRKARITLGDLLTMRSGLACDDYDAKSPGNESRMYEEPDWVKAALDLPMASDPGTVARYCSVGVAVAGRVTERAVHTSLPEFAQASLFGPLGIRRADWRWNYTLTNANREFAQIHLRPRDMLKLGLMYADSGRWNGKQVLSQRWVAASLAPQTQLDDTGYGYFWWRPWLGVTTPDSVNHRVTFSVAQGNGGQKIYIVPEHDLVAVFTGGAYNSGGSPPNRIMARVILPRLLAARGGATAADR